jgi:MYXO-CTERM domain-containing protein
LKRLALSLGIILLALPATAATISGTATQVTNKAGTQTEPSISGDIVVYTDRSVDSQGDVAYVDLNVGTEVVVAGGPGAQRLHDVSGDRIVYSDASTGNVYVHTISTGDTDVLDVTILNPMLTTTPGIDGDRVVFQWIGNTTTEIGYADLATGTVALLTSTPEIEADPAVGGDIVVFERSALGGTTEIYAYNLTTTEEWYVGAGTNPHTDGKTIVYDAAGTSDRDVVVYDVSARSGAPLQQAGNQTDPHVEGAIVAYDDVSGTDPDVVVHHLPSDARTSVGNGAIEELNDIDGNRVAYTSTQSGNPDVWVFEFTVDSDPPPPPPEVPDPCEDDSELGEPIYSASFVRERGKPAVESDSFSNGSGHDQAVVVVRNERCASGLVFVNGEQIVSPDDLDANATCGSGVITVDASNDIEVELRSQPGCELTVDVFPISDVEAEAAGCAAAGPGDVWSFAWLGFALLLVRRRRRS